MTDKKTNEMNLLERLNRRKRQASLSTIAATLGRAYPSKGKLLKILRTMSNLGNTPEEWNEQPLSKQATALNKIRLVLRLDAITYSDSHTRQTMKELIPLIIQFDGTNKTTTNYYIGMPQSEPANTMLKRLTEVMKR